MIGEAKMMCLRMSVKQSISLNLISAFLEMVVRVFNVFDRVCPVVGSFVSLVDKMSGSSTSQDSCNNKYYCLKVTRQSFRLDATRLSL